MITAVYRSPNKLWRSNSNFNLWSWTIRTVRLLFFYYLIRMRTVSGSWLFKKVKYRKTFAVKITKITLPEKTGTILVNKSRLRPFTSTFLLFSRGYNLNLQSDVVYLGSPIAPLYITLNAGGRGGVAGSQPMSTAVHRSGSPNKLWRSNSIFNLCFSLFLRLNSTIQSKTIILTSRSGIRITVIIETGTLAREHTLAGQ